MLFKLLVRGGSMLVFCTTAFLLTGLAVVYILDLTGQQISSGTIPYRMCVTQDSAANQAATNSTSYQTTATNSTSNYTTVAYTASSQATASSSTSQQTTLASERPPCNCTATVNLKPYHDPALRASTMNAASLTKLGSRSKSIVFIKAYKVGGTTISSILSAYSFNTNQAIAPIDAWCRGYPFEHYNGHCIDLIGTDHPRIGYCRFEKIQSPSFCKEPEVFMMIRDPVQRLTSGYKHELRANNGISIPVEEYVQSKTILKTPSHELLDLTPAGAVEKAKKINILLHHLYDESLVYMAVKTGMKLCDIMYAPCTQDSVWGASKCSNSNVTLTAEETARISRLASDSGEQYFYDSVVKEAETRLRDPWIAQLTIKYRTMRSTALSYCLEPNRLKAINEMLSVRPYVSRDTITSEKLWHLIPERSNPLDPLTICLGWYCQERS